MAMMRAGAVYFLLVFGAGFAFGVLRVLLVVPAIGERLAELTEAPLMLLVIFLAARWTVYRFHPSPGFWPRFGIGATALGLLLLAEWGVVVFVREQTVGQYLTERDPVAGAVYFMSLVVFLLMPVFVRRTQEEPMRNP